MALSAGSAPTSGRAHLSNDLNVDGTSHREMNQSGRGAMKEYTILLVEDTADVRTMMRAMLERRGFTVKEAADGLEAIEVVRREIPDAILLDMSLPRADGYQTARLIRQLPGCKDLPIIACTAYNQWEWRAKSISAGCTAFVSKPLDFDQLNALLLRLLTT
jgi:CheY-like chemotaxis protein